MAGAGYRLFATGDVLTAAQVNTYLQQQTVMVFADSSARTTALSGVLAEGMVSYLQSDDTVYVYNGSAWVSIANSGDITSVVAGNGLSGGATSGAATLTIDTAVTVDKTTAQTLTNKTLTSPALTTPTISTLTTAGDTVYGTGSGVLSRLGIGTAGQVLTVNSGATAPQWSTAASGGMTLLSTSTLSSTSTTISGISGSYNSLYIVLNGVTTASTATVRFSTNNSSSLMSTYRIDSGGITRTLLTSHLDLDDAAQQPLNSATTNLYTFLIQNYANTATYKTFYGFSSYQGTSSGGRYFQYGGGIASNTATDSITFTTSAGGITFNAGTVKIYGVN